MTQQKKELILALIFWVEVMGFKGKIQFTRLVCFIKPQINKLSQKDFSDLLKKLEGVWQKPDLKRLENLYNDREK